VGVSCNECHGGFGYADWKTNCTFCHGTRTQGWTEANLRLAAPPQSIAGTGDQTSANPKVGAHQAHLGATTYVNPLPCTSCHGVPLRQFPGSLTHVDGQPVTPAFSGLATQGVTGAAYAGNGGTCAVYCHGSGTAFVNPGAPASTKASPAWTETSIACDGCHGTPPTTGEHGFANHQFPCGYCHLDVAGSGATPSIVNKALHVNGQKDVRLTVPGTWDPAPTAKTCTNVACHNVQDTRGWYPPAP
jgi:predicted CxxxxCH...CXXCH cytochrome family protein